MTKTDAKKCDAPRERIGITGMKKRKLPKCKLCDGSGYIVVNAHKGKLKDCAACEGTGSQGGKR